MPSPVTFGASALKGLAERTDYEAWLLEAVYAIVEQELFPSWPDAVVYPAGESTARFFGYARGNIILGDWRPGFLNAGAPLVFVSTFKVLDMLIEWILERNGVSSTFRFQEKLRHLKGTLVFPQVVESRPWLKERLIALYGALEPLRGTIIHDKHFAATDGAIRVSSSKRGVVGVAVDVTASHLRTLAVTIVSVLRYIDGTWQLNELRERMLRHDLDELAALHGTSLLGQKRPFHTGVRVYVTDPDPLRVDPDPIRREVVARYVDQDCSFDLRVLIVEGCKVVDAYLFPWAQLGAAGWPQGIDAQQYKNLDSG